MSILILGASGGIGRALAARFVANGEGVFVHYRSNDPGPGYQVQANLGYEEEVKRMFSEIASGPDALRAMVYAVGIHSDNTVERMSLLQFKAVLEINLTGAFLCAKYALPIMAAGGRIVFLSSIVGQAGVPGCANYAASKAGLEGFARSLAREVAPRGITVNTIALGYTELGMISDISERRKEAIIGDTPTGRLVTGDEIFALVDYLIGPVAGAVTGQTINLNGGLYLG
jgi:3-oxoacyl-[acyl-carrier protein] reductase